MLKIWDLRPCIQSPKHCNISRLRDSPASIQAKLLRMKARQQREARSLGWQVLGVVAWAHFLCMAFECTCTFPIQQSWDAANRDKDFLATVLQVSRSLIFSKQPLLQDVQRQMTDFMLSTRRSQQRVGTWTTICFPDFCLGVCDVKDSQIIRRVRCFTETLCLVYPCFF